MVHPVIFALSLLCLNLFLKIARYQWLSLILILNPDKPGWQKTQWTNGFFSCFSFLFSALQIVTLPPLKSKFKTNNFLFPSKQGWNFFKSVPNFLQMVFQMFQIFEYLFLHYTLHYTVTKTSLEEVSAGVGSTTPSLVYLGPSSMVTSFMSSSGIYHDWHVYLVMIIFIVKGTPW